MKPEQYSQMVKEASPRSPHFKHLSLAFLVGGFICALGEGIAQLCKAMHVSEDHTKVIVPCALVLLAAVLTAFGVFDKIGRHAGAGTGVPITGFANAIVAPAMEHHKEGLVLGVGANMFRLAGPVLAYGTAICSLYGVIYYFFLRGRGNGEEIIPGRHRVQHAACDYRAGGRGRQNRAGGSSWPLFGRVLRRRAPRRKNLGKS